MKKIRSICVYCGSSIGNNMKYHQAAEDFGKELAKAGIRLVYGGGNRGIMGAVARSTQKHGGHVTGIIPEFLMTKEAPENENFDPDELIVTETMHQRKQLMFQNSDAFVTLPGGIGTLEEIIEMITWAQLGQHKKPLVYANICGFWNPLAILLDHMLQEGFINETTRATPIFVDRIENILRAIVNAIETR